MNKQHIFNHLAALAALALLLGLTGCLPELPEPQSAAQFPTAAAPPSQVSPLATPARLSQVSPLATATRPTPAPTDDDVAPTPAPTTTPPPFPTSLPTPVVTPIPTAAPPIIPEVVDKAQQLFWIIYWQGNEIWRIDDQGKERQLLLDTYKSLGLYLTANPQLETLVSTYQEQRVKVSPDGKKLALTVVDKPGLARQGEKVAFSIYLFDIQTSELKLLSEGASPDWSPDGKRIAFVRGLSPDGTLSDGGLWIANLGTGQVYPLVKGNPTNPVLHISYWTWSPDSQRVAYRYGEGLIDKPEIWIKSTADSSSPSLVPNIPIDIFHWCFSWMPDGQNLLCGTQDGGRPDSPTKLWAVSVKTGERKQLTQGFYGGAGPWSPDGKWLAFSAVRPYEREKETYDHDIWLLSADGAQLLRVTSAPPQSIGEYWSPDGTRLVFRREGVGLATMSLESGKVTPVGVSLPDTASYNYAVGGSK